MVMFYMILASECDLLGARLQLEGMLNICVNNALVCDESVPDLPKD